MRWRLLVFAAKLCGLQVGAVTSRLIDGALSIVVLARSDADTVQALAELSRAYMHMRDDDEDGPREVVN